MHSRSLDAHGLTASIAYCGLVCRLCFLADKCDGCKSEKSQCESDMSDQGCYQKQCCITQSLNGCWQCVDLQQCKQGIYSQDNLSKVKAFALYVQKRGPDLFVSAILRNMQEGLSVEKGKDYDNLEVTEVHRLLDYGRR